MRPSWICGLVVAVCASSVLAQDFRPRLMVPPQEKIVPPVLSKAEVRVVIAGYLAETTLTLTFTNPNDRVLEGELVFPLPEGATISGYGLDVSGEMVDGVPVEKTKARVTFETEVRKGVDPGLVEHVKGNNFRTRVYPLPARGQRTVKVQYISELARTADGPAYVLPTNWGNEVVKEYALRVELVRPAVPPALRGEAARDLAPRQVGNRVLIERAYADAKFRDDLTIVLPKAPAAGAIVEKRIGSDDKAQHYFVIHDVPAAPAVDRLTRMPNHIGVLWDASLSRAEADKAREIELLRAYVKKINNGQIDLVVFRNTVDEAKAFAIKDGQCDALFDYLSKLPYDGATDLGRLSIVRGPQQIWILFTDGLGNLGADMPAKVESPVFVVSNDARANHVLLGHVAQSTGGTYFNLKRVGDAEALANLGVAGYSFLGIDAPDGAIAEVYPAGVTSAMGAINVSGILLADEAEITLKYGYGTEVMARSKYTLKKADAESTGLAARQWAQQKVAALSVFEEKNREPLLALGREFNLVTPNTSLMVLETLEQYVQYDITPPKNREKMYAAFMDHKEKTKAALKKEDKTAKVIAMWEGRVKWWEKEFKYPKDFKYVAPADKKNGEGLLQGGGGRAPATAARPGAESAPVPRPATPAPRVAEPTGGERGGEVREQRMRDLAGDVDRLERASKDDEDPIAMHSYSRTKVARASIAIKPWSPDTPYLKALKADPAQAYAVYLQQRKDYAASPAFYFDCGDFLVENNQRELGIRVLTNIAELQLDSAPLLRVAAHRFQQIGQLDLAVDLFEKVLQLRPEEPQSHRDLALALAARAEAVLFAARPSLSDAAARADYSRAMSLLNDVVMKQWNGRFEQIELPALMELNRLSARGEVLGISSPIDPRLKKLLDLDVRIVLTWDADATDIDLHVVEPSGEECFYGHNLTTIGGHVSQDFTQGYGPEEYIIRRAMPGEYVIRANFFGSSQQKVSGPCTVQATVITNFGRPDEQRQSMTLRLAERKENFEIGRIRVGK